GGDGDEADDEFDCRAQASRCQLVRSRSMSPARADSRARSSGLVACMARLRTAWMHRAASSSPAAYAASTSLLVRRHSQTTSHSRPRAAAAPPILTNAGMDTESRAVPVASALAVSEAVVAAVVVSRIAAGCRTVTVPSLVSTVTSGGRAAGGPPRAAGRARG